MAHLSESASLQDWLSYIESCHPQEIELGLERFAQVAERLPIDLSRVPKIIVAGTNGKGSSTRLLESILSTAGYRVGCYTSPHFRRYNERIRLAGEEVSDQALTQAFAQIEDARGDLSLTYFEFGTLAAFLCMSAAELDVCVLEVGLGGRLDAVNWIDADVALITTVALDHTDWLGPDRESIGREKAGVMRAHTPAVCGDAEPPLSVLEQARNLGCDLRVRERDFYYTQDLAHKTWTWQGQNPCGEALKFEDLPWPELPMQNAASVIQVLSFLPLQISDEALRHGLRDARLTGRMQKIYAHGQEYLLDVAHNPESAQYLADALKSQAQGRAIHLTLGMLADKDIDEVLKALMAVVDHWHLVSLPGARGASAQRLQQGLVRLGVAPELIHLYASVPQALQLPQQPCAQPSLHVVAGSFLTVTAALEWLDPLPETDDVE